ncbi:low temperature requirement protein A [Micromonospora sp. NPDC000668]|uniref:low temperature requirement protein A n=1 Tax=Micromonospora sp. NPDC000668 TaxID=3364219 RepID=UPI0036BD1F0E
MRRTFRSRPVLTEETHRATTFEIFFDIVFVFALTRLIAFMGEPPTLLSMAQGMLLLLLLMISWGAYTWLGNQARADTGLVPAGTVIAMAAIFVAALVIPDAWRHGRDVNAPLTLAVAYIVIRAVQLALYFYAAAEDRQLRAKLLIFAIPTALGWIALILGAVQGGTAQTLLWAAAFVIDIGGGRVAYVFRGGWPLRSPRHFAERHGLVLIIALGESLISVGTGAGTAVARWPVLVAALLGLSMTVCLWWLYFANAAAAAAQALAQATGIRRDKIASDAYSLGLLPLIAGVIYLALGTEQVLADLARNRPQHPFGEPLDWTSTTALYGGVVLYLTGRLLFLRLAVRSAPTAQLVAVGVALLLLPAARGMPSLAALGLLTAFLIALACYELLAQGSEAVTPSG